MISVKPIPSPLARLRYLWPFFFLLAALCYPQTSLLASRVSPAAPSASSKGAMSFIHSGAEEKLTISLFGGEGGSMLIAGGHKTSATPTTATALDIFHDGTKVGGVARSSDGRIVIRENMDRVRAAAQRLGAETFEGTGMEANRAWILQKRSLGYEVYDIGPDFARRLERIEQGIRPDSPFYNMERVETLNYDKYFKLFERTGKYEGGVPGLDH